LRVVARVDGDVGRVGDGAGVLDAPEHVGRHVLDGLEAADHAPELLALERVGDGHVEASLGPADLLDREGRTRAVEDALEERVARALLATVPGPLRVELWA